MKLAYLLSLITAALATPVPANKDLRPSSTTALVVASSSSLASNTFSTLIPSYTPVPRQLSKEEIHFNNKEELEKRAVQAEKSNVEYVKRSAPVPEPEVVEYKLEY
ncbi:hypothetical protein CLIB1423_10S01090 [[Candida] railenensis]|uniref:Uncharacterized protein n=1 Tax=[Candida] railenensis TaxID=45579 RepID=A0A9P0QRW5_9ASCO|nr:hypothetical protein CLIB1423_10S01090 [[Candida] railenensis]